ncbi:hypothetical protein I3842_09G152000 [Carya illinoinensis]|uniref:Uncharacterized protein n=1 Tax=Carya illinoinensis TaxID=32201 RepID=A0A922E5I0_CARIL|nr:hypothetical protein I3842_09G152000 [Carya illinoinensis]
MNEKKKGHGKQKDGADAAQTKKIENKSNETDPVLWTNEKKKTKNEKKKRKTGGRERASTDFQPNNHTLQKKRRIKTKKIESSVSLPQTKTAENENESQPPSNK